MLEVGRLKNYYESRTHFSAWAIMSSPLILSFDLREDKVMDEMWPIISNRDVIAVNQRWAGSPGNRLAVTGAVNGNVGNSSQIWSKPLGNLSHAVLFMSTGPEPATFALPFPNISSDFVSGEVCVRDLYTKIERGPIEVASHTLQVTVPVHDSAFYCVRMAVGGSCKDSMQCPAFTAKAEYRA
eukprot:SAG31_NODE_1143_length_9694_cov_5.541011_2_plen_183_part_00